MQTAFEKVSRLLEGEIIISPQPPFGAFAPADSLRDFFDTLSRTQEKEGRAIHGGIVYGGVFTDLHAGRKPKDIDIFIASPDMVRALHGYQSGGYADDDYTNEDEWAQIALGHSFPINPYEGLSGMKHSVLIGDYFEFTAPIIVNGMRQLLDIKIGTHNPSLPEFVRHLPAPIMSAAMSLGGDHQYAYHQHCVDHADRGILCTDRIGSANLIEKAQRKGLELITPAQLASREKQVEVLMNAQSLEAQEARAHQRHHIQPTAL